MQGKILLNSTILDHAAGNHQMIRKVKKYVVSKLGGLTSYVFKAVLSTIGDNVIRT